jgi:hypothetical protein
LTAQQLKIPVIIRAALTPWHYMVNAVAFITALLAYASVTIDDALSNLAPPCRATCLL